MSPSASSPATGIFCPCTPSVGLNLHAQALSRELGAPASAAGDEPCQLSLTMNAELVEDRAEVAPHRRRSDAEPGRSGLTAVTAGDLDSDRGFGRGQPEIRGELGGLLTRQVAGPRDMDKRRRP